MTDTFDVQSNFLFDLVSKLPISEATKKDYVDHLLNWEVESALSLLFLVLADVNVLE